MKKIILITMLTGAVFAQPECKTLVCCNQDNWQEFYNNTLSGRDMTYCDLRGADLRDANLKGANLENADLTDANLEGANLDGANLDGAIFTQSDCNKDNWQEYYNSEGRDMTRCDLSQASLYKTDLTNANLTYANLRGADLKNANLTGATLEGADLTGAMLYGVISSGIVGKPKSEGLDYGTKVENGYLIGPRIHLKKADLRGADLSNAQLHRVNLAGADLTGADLTNAQIFKANLYGTNFTGARLVGVTSGDNVGPPDNLPEGSSFVNGKLEIIKYSLLIADKIANTVADHYICFNGDDNSMVIWVSYTLKEKALEVKYKGQDKAMQLVHTKGDSRFPGAYIVSDDYYIEMVDGKENGQYKITHSGIWDYVEYKRGTDGKIFRFTIDFDANPYGKAPCF